MAKLNLTPQQSAAVENRGGSLLVSAAAGSGKTKVLVERLFRYITAEHCHVDDFLIITYTKAAAAELRSKISEELSRRLAETPGDRHLRSQLLRVYQADIKTVDAFCTALLRENTHLLAQDGEKHTLTPDFRVLDENDAALLRKRVLGRVLEAPERRCWQIRWGPAGMTALWKIWCWRPMKSSRAMRPRRHGWSGTERPGRSAPAILTRHLTRMRFCGRCGGKCTTGPRVF